MFSANSMSLVHIFKLITQIFPQNQSRKSGKFQRFRLGLEIDLLSKQCVDIFVPICLAPGKSAVPLFYDATNHL